MNKAVNVRDIIKKNIKSNLHIFYSITRLAGAANNNKKYCVRIATFCTIVRQPAGKLSSVYFKIIK